MCESSSLLELIYFIKFVLKFIMIAAPVVLIVTLIIRYARAVIGNEEIVFSKLLSESAKKITLVLVLFLISSFINIVISFTGNDTSSALSECFNNANKDKIRYYKAVEDIEKMIIATTNVPIQSNLDKLKKVIEEHSEDLDSEVIIDYTLAVTELEQKVNETTLKANCLGKGGTFVNGYCEENSYTSEGISPTEMASDNDYYVINTKISPKTYYNNYIKKYHIYQKPNYPDKCLGMAYIYAYSMYTGSTTARGKDSVNNSYKATSFYIYNNDNKQNVLNKVYDQLVKNKPVILHVNGNSAGTSRHYVTIIGFKKSVQSASSLKESDLLMIDTYDGAYVNLTPKRRMITGAACKKSYTGYQMLYLK